MVRKSPEKCDAIEVVDSEVVLIEPERIDLDWIALISLDCLTPVAGSELELSFSRSVPPFVAMRTLSRGYSRSSLPLASSLRDR